MRKVQVCALLAVGAALLVACGSDSAKSPAEAAPEPVAKIAPAQESTLDTTPNTTTSSRPTTLNPATSQTAPAYEPPNTAVAPSSSTGSDGGSTATNLETIDRSLVSNILESTQGDLFIERDAIDALSDELFLEILSPSEDVAFVESPNFVLTARTVLDAAVSVNDDLVDVDEEGILKVVLILEEGPNLIEVVTSLSNGDEKSAVLTIFYLP